MKNYPKQLGAAFSDLMRRRFFGVTFFVSLALIAIVAGFFYWRLMPIIQPQMVVPLHYNIHFGVDLFGAWWRVFLHPLFALVILLVNTVFAVAMAKRDIVLSYFLMTMAMCVTVVFTVASFFVYLLNISYYG